MNFIKSKKRVAERSWRESKPGANPKALMIGVSQPNAIHVRSDRMCGLGGVR
jgi:hypothetical protein